MVVTNSTLPAATDGDDLPSAVVATLLVLISATLEVCGAVLRKRAHNYGVLARALWRAWSVQTSANDEDFLDLEIWSPQYWLGFAMFIASRVALLVVSARTGPSTTQLSTRASIHRSVKQRSSPRRSPRRSPHWSTY